MIFALPLINPNTIVPYNDTLIWDTPHVNRGCSSLYGNRQNLSKDELGDYVCFCTNGDYETKKYIEGLFNLVSWLKKTDTEFLKMRSETFGHILKYLKDEFYKQDQLIKLINSKITAYPLDDDSEISVFTSENRMLSVDQFYPKYTTFLMDHLLDKYYRDFEKLKIFDIETLFAIEFGFIDCHISYDNQKNGLYDVIKTINKRVIGMITSMIDMDS